MHLLSRCSFVRHRVTSSCKSAILDRWMRAFVDRSPLDYILGQMRSAAGRAGASKTATLAFSLTCCSRNAASGARAVAWCLFLGRNFAYCSGFLSFFQQSLCDGASAVCLLRSSRSSPRKCVAITFVVLQCLLRCRSVLWFLARFGSRRQVLSQQFEFFRIGFTNVTMCDHVSAWGGSKCAI